MLTDIEAAVDAALVAILDSDGVVRGTGFVVDAAGSVITCHHVVDGQDVVRLRDSAGSTVLVEVRQAVLVPRLDLAMLRLTHRPQSVCRPLPLSAESGSTERFWTKGYHRQGGSVRAAFPVQGRIIGTTSVSYGSGLADYAVDDVLVLRGDTLRDGLSGAPVIDPASGAVVAVISTKLKPRDPRSDDRPDPDDRSGGFAVPLRHVADHPRFEALFADNARTVPTFGAHLNASGARALCARQKALALDQLGTLRGVDLDRRVPRRSVQAGMARFVAGDAAMLALVGTAGVGKSTELAAFAAGYDGPMLFIRASTLAPDCRGLDDAVEATLHSLPDLPRLPADPARALAAAVAGTGKLLILLDGLNEAPLGRDVPVEEWMLRTRSWLAQARARLIVSSRPELWSLIDRQPSSDSPVISIGEFDDDELAEAIHRYGLDEAPSPARILRLPIALSLLASAPMADVDRARRGGLVSAIIERYVDRACSRIAARIGPLVTPQAVRGWLEEVALAMYEQDDDVLDLRALDAILPPRVSAAEPIVAEHLMSAASRGLRFVYDDIGDWLAARRLRLDEQLAPESLARLAGSSWRRIGPLAYAIRELERTEGPQALHDCLDRLMAEAPRRQHTTRQLVQQTLAKVDDASGYIAILRTLAHSVASLPPRRRVEDLTFWRTVGVSTRERLDLLHVLVPHDYYGGWRPKDWADRPFHDDGYATLALDAVRRAPAEGFRALLPWLGDHTSLSNDRGRERGEATVAHVAMGILYELRRADPALLWQVLHAAGPGAARLVAELERHDPALLHEMTVRHATKGGWSPQDSQRPLLAVAAITPTGETVLSGQSSLAATSNEALAAALRAGGPRAETLLAQLGSADAPALLAEIADATVLSHLTDAGLPITADIAIYVERRLHYSETASTTLTALVRHLIQHGNERALGLAYALTSPKALSKAPDQRATLLGEFIDDAGHAARLRVIDLLARDADQHPVDINLLRRAADQLEPDDADHALYRGAYRHPEFAGILCRSLHDDAIPAYGPLTHRLRELTAAGQDSRAATRTIFEEEIAKGR